MAVPSYRYSPERALQLEVSVGGVIKCTATLFATSQDPSTLLNRLDVTADAHGEIFLQPPVPSTMRLELDLQGDPAAPFLLVVQIRQPKSQPKADVLEGRLDDHGHALHSVSFAARYRRLSDSFVTLRQGEALSESWATEFFSSPLRRQIRELVTVAASERSLELSPAAQAMMVIPLVEQIERRGHEPIPPEPMRASIDQLIEEMAHNPDARDSDPEDPGRRSAVSLIRAFWARFCRIPPFCGPGENLPNPELVGRE